MKSRSSRHRRVLSMQAASVRRWLFRGALLGLGVLGSACLGPVPREAQSLGRPSLGSLINAIALSADPPRDAGYVLARPTDDTRWGTPALVGMLQRAARAVRSAFPAGSPLRIGDLSARYGGDHARHGSHRTGRDVDVLFFLTGIDGTALSSSGFFAFDRRGVSRAGTAKDAPLASFDTPRNWAFVRALLVDSGAHVQWVFCSGGVKARLLAYAARTETNADVLFRASYLLHEPSYGNPHDDHFHIRIACTGEDRALGCIDDGPTWPWLRNEHEKPAVPAGAPDDDAALLAHLLAP